MTTPKTTPKGSKATEPAPEPAPEAPPAELDMDPLSGRTNPAPVAQPDSDS